MFLACPRVWVWLWCFGWCLVWVGCWCGRVLVLGGWCGCFGGFGCSRVLVSFLFFGCCLLFVWLITVWWFVVWFLLGCGRVFVWGCWAGGCFGWCGFVFLLVLCLLLGSGSVVPVLSGVGVACVWGLCLRLCVRLCVVVRLCVWSWPRALCVGLWLCVGFVVVGVFGVVSVGVWGWCGWGGGFWVVFFFCWLRVWVWFFVCWLRVCSVCACFWWFCVLACFFVWCARARAGGWRVCVWGCLCGCSCVFLWFWACGRGLVCGSCG